MYQKESMSFLIEANYASLRASEKKAADYILENPEAAAGMGLSCLAQKAGVSQPTVVRFAKALGFKGYKEFQHCLLAQARQAEGVRFLMPCTDMRWQGKRKGEISRPELQLP